MPVGQLAAFYGVSRETVLRAARHHPACIIRPTRAELELELTHEGALLIACALRTDRALAMQRAMVRATLIDRRLVRLFVDTWRDAQRGVPRDVARFMDALTS